MILKPDNSQQIFFTSRAELVSGEDLLCTIDEVVNRLDLIPLYACWSEGGRAFYDPAMMLKILFFAYCDGERHSRQIAKRIKYDIRYQYFTGSLRPKYRTICRFRTIDNELLASYFVQIVSICEQMGLLNTSMLAIDGTKIKASASSRRTFRKKDLARLAKKYKQLLAEDAAIDLQEIGDGDIGEDEVEAEDSQEESIGDRDLKERIRKAMEKLEGEEKEVNLTDADAKFMKTSDGGIRPSYNCQAATDKNQTIVAADVVNNADDTSSFKSMVEQSRSNVSGEIGQVLVDGGYFSRSNLKYIVEKEIDVYMPTGSGYQESEEKFSRDDFIHDGNTDSYQCPAGEKLPYKYSRMRGNIAIKVYKCSSSKCRSCKLKSKCTTTNRRELNISEVWQHEKQMKEKLSTEEGERIYDCRKSMVEPVFGNMKFNLGFARFVLRGLKKVKGEFMLMCIAHNLKKMSRYWGKLRPAIESKIVLAEGIYVFSGLFLCILRKVLNRWVNPSPKVEYV